MIKELVDKKSAKYSDRPESYIGQTVITSGDHLLVMRYNQKWRSFRKLVHQHFMESVVEKNYIELQNAEAVQMIRDMCLRPDQHMKHPKRFSNSIIMSLLFGLRTPSVDTPHMTQLYSLMENWSHIMEQGATPPVDIYPFLHLVPQSLFGNWLSRSKNVGDEMNALYGGTLDIIRKRREAGERRNSFVDGILDREDKLGLSTHEIYFLAGVLMEGGSDTTSSLIISFLAAMTKWGDVLIKAQEEIDSVVGEDRSPQWSDYAQLPYVASLVKETHRWRPVTPLAFPHATTEDDWIDGKLIPKGTTVIINCWGLHHDENRFPDNDRFDPDHFKGQTTLASELASSADYESRDHYGYGSGRRICPGLHLAERNLFLGLSKLIWAFVIEPAVDDIGNVIENDLDPVTGFSQGFLVCANDFPCRITPRSEARRATIMKEFEQAQEIFVKYSN